MKRRFITLSVPRQFFVRLCQRVNFGSILNVQVRNGELCFDGLLEVVVDLKLDVDVGRRRELDLTDFDLTDESCRLLDALNLLTDGVIERVVVHDGLPRRIVFRGSFPEIHQ